MYVRSAQSLMAKVVAIFNKPFPELTKKDGVRVFEDCTVVKCMIRDGVATLPSDIVNFPGIAGEKLMDKVVQKPLKPTYAMTAIESSELRGNKHPGKAIVPVNVDGTKPTGNVPKDAKNNSGKPTAFVNDLTEVVLISVDDVHNRDNFQNIDHISAAELTINPKTGKFSRSVICDRKTVNIRESGWDKKVIDAVGKTYLNAAKAALYLTWGLQNGKCPFWVKPVETTTEKETTEKKEPETTPVKS